MLAEWKGRVRKLKRETFALYLACKDPRTPWYAKLLAAAVVAYAFSPIDLIPDFVPVIGYLDDLILVPLGIMAAVRLVPEQVMSESRDQARLEMSSDKPVSWVGAGIVGLIWATCLTWVGWRLWIIWAR